MSLVNESTSQGGSERRRRVPGGRGRQFHVRVTDEEFELLRAKAIRYDVSVQKLLVDAALSTAAEVAMDNASTRAEVLAQLFNAQRFLASIASNVNQIAKVANASEALSPEQIHELDMVLPKARQSVFDIEDILRNFSKAWPR